ncbi:hypothetical protein V8F20_004733 [Naviculisporaceae sp. PSN 640]
MNTLSIILLISTTFSLITSLIGPLSNLWKVVSTIPRRIGLLHNEVRTMGDIVGECLSTIEQNPTRAPAHIEDLGVATYEQWKDIDQLAKKTLEATAPDTESVLWRSLLRVQRVRWIVKREGELTSQVADLRGRVGLLRDACSELRIRSQIVEMSAVISRLNDMPGAKSWPGENYIVNGVVELEQNDNKSTAGVRGIVLLEDQRQAGGRRFGYHPARIKIDASSAADIVSLEYLQRLGLDLAELREIPEQERRQVNGLNGIIYMPTHMIDLYWYQVGEMQMNTTSFLVVSSTAARTPGFDLLLSARRYVETEERQFVTSSEVIKMSPAEQIEADYHSLKNRRKAIEEVEGDFWRTGNSKSQNYTSRREGFGGSKVERSRSVDLEMGNMRETNLSSGSVQRLVNS